MANESAVKKSFAYSTRDIVIVAVIAAIAGIVNTGVGILWSFLNTLGPLYGALLQGSFMWAYILAAWLIRKPGAALLVGVIESVVEILLGNPSGVGTLGWGISQGIGLEAVLLIAGYARWNIVVALCAGAAAAQFGTVWTAVLFGWDPAGASNVWLAAPINLVSGLLFSGLLGYYLSTALGKTGLIRSAK